MIPISDLVLSSFLAGLVIGAPVGPTGAICTSVALRGNLSAALAGGAGSATALGIWGALAGAGTAWGGAPASSVRALAGLLLVGYGTWLWSRASRSPDAAGPERPWAVTTLCFTMVMSNPAGLALLAALLAGPLGEAHASAMVSGGIVGWGVAAGCFTAFACVMPLMHRLGARAGARLRTAIGRLLALGVTCAGIAIVTASMARVAGR